MPCARSSWLIQMASRKVKIGAVATRIPASDEEMCSWPNEISMNGRRHLQQRKERDDADLVPQRAERAALQRERHQHKRGERGAQEHDHRRLEDVVQRHLDEQVGGPPEGGEEAELDP